MLRKIKCWLRGHEYPIDEESFQRYLEYGWLKDLRCMRCGKNIAIKDLDG